MLRRASPCRPVEVAASRDYQVRHFFSYFDHMKIMDTSNLFLHYLDCYAKKDIESISQMLADNVSLRDWNISVTGREAVESATRDNFHAAKSIEIEVIHFYQGPASVAGELRILVNKSIELYVVDVIVFNTASQIQAIRAYIGRND